GGAYAATVAGDQPYYPGGGNSIAGAAGVYPTNPVSGLTNVAPGAYGNLADRNTLATGIGNAAGTEGYAVQLGGNSYAVEGGNASGKAISGIGGYTLVLSNQ